jgi:hypothetical protein
MLHLLSRGQMRRLYAVLRSFSSGRTYMSFFGHTTGLVNIVKNNCSVCSVIPVTKCYTRRRNLVMNKLQLRCLIYVPFLFQFVF